MIISVWGSGGSGKSTFATKLGATLDSINKNTLVVYSENLSVDIASIYPYEKNFISMGDLWQVDMSNDDLYKIMNTAKGKNNLAYLSFAPGENIYSYPQYTKYNVVKVIMQLSDMFEYVIFDCSSDLSSNMISMTALELSDVVFRLCGSTLKSSCFFDSNLQLLSDSRFNAGSHINILSSTREYEPLSVFRSKYLNAYELPFDDSVYQQCLEGEAFELNKSKYQNTVNIIINREILLQDTLKTNGMKSTKQGKNIKKTKKDKKEKLNKEKLSLKFTLFRNKKSKEQSEVFDDE